MIDARQTVSIRMAAAEFCRAQRRRRLKLPVSNDLYGKGLPLCVDGSHSPARAGDDLGPSLAGLNLRSSSMVAGAEPGRERGSGWPEPMESHLFRRG